MARISKQPVSVAILTGIHHQTAPEHLGIEFLEVGDDVIRARVPVDARTRRPYGILHGGVSVVLAETLAERAGFDLEGTLRNKRLDLVGELRNTRVYARVPV
jgi:acyl-coenzyme A thioesterase PaaI-like protein